MPFVLDASVASCWAFEDEAHPIATEAFRRVQTDQARVPGLWWYEVRNVLVVNERRGRLTQAATSGFLNALSQFGVVLDHDVVEADVLALSRMHGLSVYDASYIEVAVRHAIPLATLDSRMARAARTAGIALLGDQA